MLHDILFILIGLVIGGLITALAYPQLFKANKEHLDFLNKQLDELKGTSII